MRVEKLTSGILDVNTYFIVNEKNSECIVIDGGEDYRLIKETAIRLNVKIVAELLTHAHFDHAGNGADFIDDKIDVYVGKNDAEKLIRGETLAEDFGLKFRKFVPNFCVNDGDKLSVAGITVKVISTPGHTDGSVSYLAENCLFTGDSLFFGSYGRTDFPTGDFKAMINSLKKLFALPDGTKVFPGHGEETTVKEERENNPINFYVRNNA